MKTKHNPKTFILGAVTVISLTFFSVKPAYSTSFSLKFLNDSGQQVGSGGFSYEDNKIRCVEATSDPAACNPPGGSPPNKEIFISNTLNSFSVTILGQDFRRSFPAWWADPSRNQQAGYQLRAFSIPYPTISIGYGEWWFDSGILFFPFPLISMKIDPTSDTVSGTGTWSAYAGSSGGLLGSGTFIATNTAIAVPEPLTLLGGMTALGFGVAFKRKIRT
ncbi:MAG: PEP-CTERM sorting domain-containing protein [Snowella sp.]